MGQENALSNMSTQNGNLPKHLKAQLGKQIGIIENVPDDSVRLFIPGASDRWTPVLHHKTLEITGYKARMLPVEGSR